MSTLEAAIREHRRMLKDELDFNPSQRTPPVAYTYSESERAMVPDDRPLIVTDPRTGAWTEVPDSATQTTATGVPMSGRMWRYLSGPSADTPWSSALKQLRAECRRRHPYHRAADRPYWRGSLCWQMVYFVCVGKPKGDGPATIREAAEILRYDDPEPVLRGALDFIEDAMDRMRQRAERRVREDAGLQDAAVRETTHQQRHDQPGMHQQECPQCRRNAA